MAFIGRVLLLAFLVSLAFALDDPSVIVKRGLSIVNASKGQYMSNQVLNYAINGNKNVGGMCVNYRTWGKACNAFAVAAVVIAKDGSNCAILITSNLFEYTSSSRGAVTLAALMQLQYVFPSGYDLRCYSKNNTGPPPPPQPQPNPNPAPSVQDIIDRANSLVGQPSTSYLSNQVLNFAINGNKNQGGNCASYKMWGAACNAATAAAVAVAKDGSNCGIFVSSKQFEYTSGSKKMVVQVPSTQLKFIFPAGYTLRCPNV